MYRNICMLVRELIHNIIIYNLFLNVLLYILDFQIFQFLNYYTRIMYIVYELYYNIIM